MTIDTIDRAALYVVGLPLKVPFETSYGRETHRESLVLALFSGDTCGYGECVAFKDPYYTYETIQTAHHIAREYLIPEVLNTAPIDLRFIANAFARVRGHEMAKAMVENAVLDLLAKSESIPLYKLIGGKNKKIKSGISIGLKGSIDALLSAIEEAQARNYHRIKIKIAKGKDIDVVKAVRAAFPAIPLAVDANGAYTLDDLSTLIELDKYNLTMIEQPFVAAALHDHSILQAHLQTPICLDESITGLTDLENAVRYNSCSIVNIKQGRVGGMLTAKSISNVSVVHGLGVWSGGMLEMGIGRAFNLHLQALPYFTMPGDTSETARYFDKDLVDQPVVLDEDGYIPLPQGAGIGVCVLEDRLGRACLSTETIKK
ncbi:MAG: o-succinylbenzoate synthase [Myxococcota bacterium]|nr:o-succinylbenzoate synthase [Myxococcota bacterium]